MITLWYSRGDMIRTYYYKLSNILYYCDVNNDGWAEENLSYIDSLSDVRLCYFGSLDVLEDTGEA